MLTPTDSSQPELVWNTLLRSFEPFFQLVFNLKHDNSETWSPVLAGFLTFILRFLIRFPVTFGETQASFF
jgi:hypothetical protein